MVAERRRRNQIPKRRWIDSVNVDLRGGTVGRADAAVWRQLAAYLDHTKVREVGTMWRKKK